YAHDDLIARFVAENPEHLTPEKLRIVASWQYRISGDFYLMRYLTKYAVFLSAQQPEHLYGVLALYDPFDVMVRGQPLPVLFKTTLLPFKGQIIYDGLLNAYNISFGAGIRRDLNATYRRLKDMEGIIEQLVDDESKPLSRTSRQARDAKPAPDWKPALDEIVAQTEKMKRADTGEQSAALGILRAAAQLAQASYDENVALGPKLKQVRRALTRLENIRFERDY
ncbi:MAG: hypothetical protein L0Y55_19885, partial [Anaerolineales bacterium]|nr:hypothetical protein [Anaerolineales bacterium]